MATSVSPLKSKISLRCAGASSPSKDRPCHQPTAAGIVVVEEAANDFSCGVKPIDGMACPIKHTPCRIDANTAKGEGNAAGHGKAIEGQRIERERPVRLGRMNPPCALAVLDGRIECARLDRGIKLGDRSL